MIPRHMESRMASPHRFRYTSLLDFIDRANLSEILDLAYLLVRAFCYPAWQVPLIVVLPFATQDIIPQEI